MTLKMTIDMEINGLRRKWDAMKNEAGIIHLKLHLARGKKLS